MTYRIEKLFDPEFRFTLLSIVGAFFITVMVLWVVLSDKRRSTALILMSSFTMMVCGLIIGILGFRKKEDKTDE